MNILLTGCAGFIGSHVAKELIKRGDTVIGIDNFNPYYDPKIKRDRISIFLNNEIKLYEGDITDYELLKKITTENKIDVICHLAAQAGVRYSIENPFAYENSNNLGTLNIFELARHNKIKKVVFASSSSVYGNEKQIPFSESQKLDTPISLYAATKKYNELMAHVYHHLYNINMIGLRFFTVYGPWGRPDMAIFKFINLIEQDKPIDVYNFGNMKRDFTYVQDIVDGVVSAIYSDLQYEIFNLGNSKTVELNYMIECIEKNLGKVAKKNLLPIQPGDVPITFADISKANKLLNYNPKIEIEQGIKLFIDWYRSYYS